MNIYFLVEGKRTEMKVYPAWLSILVPRITKVERAHLVDENNYYIFSGHGFPSLLDNHLVSSIADVNEIGKFDYLVICLDSDDDTVENRRKQVLDFITDSKIKIHNNTEIIVIVQNKSIETWFLGNSKIFKKNCTNSFIRDCVSHYNVKIDDPEDMGKPKDFEGTTASFHSSYLRELFVERNISYSKRNPAEVTEKYYLDELISRNQNTNHIKSFKTFVDFCQMINNK